MVRWTRRGRLFAAVTGLTAVVALAGACGDGKGDDSGGGGDGERTVVIASSDIAVGQTRFTFVVLDGGKPVTDQPAYVRFFRNADAAQPTVVGAAVIPWVAIGAKEEEHEGDSHEETELTGIYYANLEFDAPGNWGLGVSLGEKLDAKNEVRVKFGVKEKTAAPAIGAKAIAADNPTADKAPLAQIHTGSDADPTFHAMSIRQAISSGKPSVIAFATPSFCRTRTCGPALQVAIGLEPKFRDKVNFVHVEPYELDATGNLVPESANNPFKVVDAGAKWNLPTEPWVFVVDGSGAIVARFDGAYTSEELEFYLTKVTGG